MTRLLNTGDTAVLSTYDTAVQHECNFAEHAPPCQLSTNGTTIARYAQAAKQGGAQAAPPPAPAAEEEAAPQDAFKAFIGKGYSLKG